MLACAAGHPAAVDTLLSEPRVKLNDVNNAGNTAFMLACRSNRAEVIQLLLEHADRIGLRNPAPYSSLLPSGLTLSQRDLEPIHLTISSRLVELLPQFSRSQPSFDQPVELATVHDIRDKVELQMSRIRTLKGQITAFF